MASEELFKERLKQRRKALDLTQAELAHKIGCSIYTLQHIEEGTARPSRQLAELLAAALAIPPSERPAFVQEVRALGWRAALARTPLSARAPGGAPSTAPGDTPSPYKGLRAFQEADAPDFFGRDALTARLRERLGEETELARFLAVVGPSGAGKSSVVRAGLLPALRGPGLGGGPPPVVADLIPGPRPWEELEAALLRVAVNPQPRLLEQLQADERGLARAVKWVLPGDDGGELLLVIDQFEELFTLGADEPERARFIASLFTAVADAHSRLRVVITLRADFYDRPLRYVPASELLGRRTEVIGPLAAEEMYQAITGPAQRHGLELEHGLVARIMQDVGEQPGTLPLLQYTLTELYERREGHRLTRAAYEASGGLFGSLARRAESLYTALSAAEQAEARQLFLRLVTPGATADDTRRRVLLAELRSAVGAGSEVAAGLRSTQDDSPRAAALERVLDRYGRYRMLTFDRDLRTSAPTVEVAHEALLRSWPRVRGWMEVSREQLLVQRRLLTSAAEWQAAGQDRSFLASGGRLAQFSGLLAEGDGSPALALTAEEHGYLTASLDAQRQQEAAEQDRQTRERALQRRAASRLRTLVAGLAVFLLVAAGLAVWALNRSQVAQANEQAARTNLTHSEARRLAAEANSLIRTGGPSELAGLLSLRSMQLGHTAEGDAALEAAAQLDYPVRRFGGLTSPVLLTRFFPGGQVLLTEDASGPREWDVATGRPMARLDFRADTVQIAADGRRILGGAADGTIRVWDTRALSVTLTLTEPLAPDGQRKPVMGVAYSPDGRFILSTSRDRTARLWDAQTGRQVQVFHGPAAFGRALAWSPDGRYVVTGDDGNLARLWDAQTGLPVRTFQTELPPGAGAAGGVQFLAYAPDGKTIAGASWSSIQLWDAATGVLLREFRGHTDFVYDGAFSPDGKTLLTCSVDGTVRLWDAATGQQVRVLHGPNSAVFAAAFTPDGRQAVAGYRDGTVLLWDLGGPAYPPMPAGGQVRTVTFSADDRLVLTGSPGGRQARLFDATTGRQLPPMFPGPQKSTVNSAAFSPDGKFLLTADGGPDNAAHVWDTGTGAVVLTFPIGDIGVDALYSPDGKIVVTTQNFPRLRLWDALSARPLRTITVPGPAEDFAFTRDGQSIATINGDHPTASLWDVATGREVQRFQGLIPFGRGVAISPDGKWLATGGDDKIARLWDIATGQEVRRFVGHTDAVWHVAFSPDGQWLATASADKTARLWDVATGQEVRRYSGHAGTVRSVAFSHDGKLVLTGSLDGTARIWRIDYHDTMRYLCSALRRDLTPDERVQYGITDRGPTCPAH
jgi:WD40 repeat protein/transcriptional regulator with XRE-family HTH domain